MFIVQFILLILGRGIRTNSSRQRGDFLLQYAGKLFQKERGKREKGSLPLFLDFSSLMDGIFFLVLNAFYF